MDEKTVYSYHTFMIPFVLEKMVNWPVDEGQKNGWERIRKNAQEDMLRRYFTPEARELLFDAKNEKKGEAFYQLKQEDKTFQLEKVCKELVVEYLYMMWLDNGVGVLVVKTENTACGNAKIIEKINECENLVYPAKKSGITGNTDWHPDVNQIHEKILGWIQKFTDNTDNGNGVAPILGSKVLVRYKTCDSKTETAGDDNPWVQKLSEGEAWKHDGLSMQDYIAMVVLLQRATIEHFYAESRKLSIDFNNNLPGGKKTVNRRKCIDEVEKLYSDCVKARNALFVHQLSMQNDGIEMYEKLQEKLKIQKDMEILDEKLSSLCELGRFQTGRTENKMLSAIAIFGLPLTMVSMIWDMWGMLTQGQYLAAGVPVGIGVLLGLILFFVWKRK